MVEEWQQRLVGRHMHWDDDGYLKGNNDEYIVKIGEWLFNGRSV